MSAVIFGPNYVKTLKAGLNLFNNSTIYSGNIDPSSTGFAANPGDVYLSTLTNDIFIKQGSGDTAWSAASTVGGSWKIPVANFAALPGSGNTSGDVRITVDTGIAWEWTGSAWQLLNSTKIGSFGSSPNNDGLSVDSTTNTLNLQPADGTHPGALSTTTQTIAGNKTFTGSISASNLSNTNSGDVTLTAVGSSPSANAASLSGQALTLQPADATHPGVITTTSQTIAGSKTLSGLLNVDGGIDLSTSGTLTIGATNSTTINIGNSGATVNIQGTTIYENTPQLLTSDPLITVNHGGGAGSGQNAGVQVEENSIVTGYAETSSDRNSWILKAPATAGIATVTPGSSGITLNQSSHDPVTFAAVGSTPSANGASLSSQVITLQPADGTHPGLVTSGTQTIGGAKTFSGAISASNLSGTNTGDQTITLTSDVTGSGTGSFATTIAANAVTNSKLATMTSNTVKANKTGGTATPTDVALGSLTETTSSVLTISGTNTNIGNTTIAVTQSTTSTSGYLSSTDWNTFNGKQASGNYITALTSDVSASGPGSAAATVNSVGGSSATNVHNAELLANAATNLNTASAIVKRDGSGNFTAGTVTAALTGTASGNTTYTANNHGVVISSSSNAMTVIAPDASATKVLKSGGTGADPSWLAYDNANTASTLVFRDSSNNFSAGTITATLSGNATNVSGTVAIANGGTGQTSATNAFNALSPITTKGDLIVGTGSNAAGRLGVGINGQAVVADSTQTTGLNYANVLTNPMTTLGDVIYENATPAPARLAGNTTSTINFLSQTGTGSVSAAPVWSAFTAPTIQTFLQSLYYTFTVTAANATVGATYTNNAKTFTVIYTISGGTTLVCSGTGAPSASGTLTKATGTGDATITFSTNAANGTYQLPASPRTPLYIHVEMVGGGGGGGGGGATGGTAGGNGGNTTFGSSLLVANGGSGGPVGASSDIGGAGGTASLGTGPVGLAITGGAGGTGTGTNGTTAEFNSGGIGGSSAFGGAGAGGFNTSGASAGATNSGSGGGAGGSGSLINAGGGGGGGSGGYIDAVITSPSSTYIFNIGAAGTAGTAGTTAGAGGAGGSGMIKITEYYQ